MNPTTSPFKFLDSYQKEDADIFFGREKETEALYHSLSGVKHLLVYGPSGAGKTSLVECGLRNQFSDADWFALTIRRGTNLTVSVFDHINEALREKIEVSVETRLPHLDFGEAVEKLFSERYQPVYLLFDQFEELLIQGSEEEKKDFFIRLNRLIRYRVPCRVLLIMREEFIGHLSEFEPLCPSIFQHRFRLEKMRRENVKEVINKIFNAELYRDYFQVEQSEQLADAILSRLPDEKKEIELTHVQVFLSELWDRANTSDTTASLPKLQLGLVKEEDNLESVLDSFLKNQLRELSTIYGEKVPLEVLASMISERHTKLQLSEKALKESLDHNKIQLQQPLCDLLDDLEERRIIRTIKAGDQTQYEISHDVLALVVGQNLTEEIKLREKARDIYRVFEEKQGYFSQEDLDYLRPYQQYSPYPPELQNRIDASELYRREKNEQELAMANARAEEEKKLRIEAEAAKKDADLEREKAIISERRAKNNARTLLLAAGIAIVIAGFAIYSYVRAERANNLAQEYLVNIYQSDIIRFKREIEIAIRNKKSFDQYRAENDVIQLEVERKDSLELLIDSLEKQIKSFEK